MDDEVVYVQLSHAVSKKNRHAHEQVWSAQYT